MFEVYVGNVGCVYYGDDIMKARREYYIYIDVVKAQYSRAEPPVVLYKDGEIVKEWNGDEAEDSKEK